MKGVFRHQNLKMLNVKQIWIIFIQFEDRGSETQLQTSSGWFIFFNLASRVCWVCWISLFLELYSADENKIEVPGHKCTQHTTWDWVSEWSFPYIWTEISREDEARSGDTRLFLYANPIRNISSSRRKMTWIMKMTKWWSWGYACREHL